MARGGNYLPGVMAKWFPRIFSYRLAVFCLAMNRKRTT